MMAIKWRAAKGALQLLAQVKPLAPHQPASSFGTVGDLNHASTSDHYPHVIAGLGSVAVVLACDMPHAERLNCHVVGEAIRQSKDPRVKYVIFDGRIFSNYAYDGFPAWTWRPYKGSDMHRTHLHVSLVAGPIADDTKAWRIEPLPIPKPTVPTPAPITNKGDTSMIFLYRQGSDEVRASCTAWGRGYYVISKEAVPHLQGLIASGLYGPAWKGGEIQDMGGPPDLFGPKLG